MLDDLVNEYNNTYHRTIKMKLINFKKISIIDFEFESNDKDSTFKADD